ncbi:hypothetical protein T484DRAFT_1898483 [Baffinella frigidus]|nr:hypothetical protein T484DRAFT_1898483 [Cryptophyta sp. CCMP2293]
MTWPDLRLCAAPPADDGLRPSEKLAAGRIKKEFEATSEHGGIRVVDNGGWDDDCKNKIAWVMKPRKLRGEEGHAHQARFVPLRLRAEWLETFRGGAVAAAVNKEVVTIAFKLVLKRDLGIPAWECWDYDASVSAKKIFSCADTNALEKAWLTQNGGKLGGGQARGAAFVGLGITPGFELRLAPQKHKADFFPSVDDFEKLSDSTKRRKGAAGAGPVDEALRKLDPATKKTRAIVELYRRAVEDKDHSIQESLLALVASTHTVGETAIAFGVGRGRIKRAKLRARLGRSEEVRWLLAQQGVEIEEKEGVTQSPPLQAWRLPGVPRS